MRDSEVINFGLVMGKFGIRDWKFKIWRLGNGIGNSLQFLLLCREFVNLGSEDWGIINERCVTA